MPDTPIFDDERDAPEEDIIDIITEEDETE
jgi:hypothetical protein